MGKSAQDSTGFRFPEGGGSDIGKYKQPESVQVDAEVHSKGSSLDDVRISLGNHTKNYPNDNPFGVKEMRGYGAATKGKKISGKQG